ncbi:SMP-30/gluconolactonase/LRE family protein [Caulobacter sp. KR2-114]|uniref:SMP-30/gluconolactonase/LRE family protein n=1 Tax=Caulobacter sp. KR2-114 TaxID=3400912 RepID=UPI003C0FE561
MDHTLQTLAEGLAFGEAPRWREGSLYFSDIHANRVMALRPDGACETIATFAGPVSGLGWLPDGRMLVVSMHDKQVLRREPDGRFVSHADLSAVATGYANDMVVDDRGNAYVGNFGFSLHPPSEVRAAAIALVSPGGAVTVAADDLLFPNGMVISPDGKTLVVAESRGRCLTAFDVAAGGALCNRRLWAAVPEGTFPDGICLDAEGAIWIASPASNEVVRLREGGEVVERIATRQRAIACMLGGLDRRTLYVLTAESTDPAFCTENHTARIEATRVETPGAGRP